MRACVTAISTHATGARVLSALAVEGWNLLPQCVHSAVHFLAACSGGLSRPGNGTEAAEAEQRSSAASETHRGETRHCTAPRWHALGRACWGGSHRCAVVACAREPPPQRCVPEQCCCSLLAAAQRSVSSLSGVTDSESIVDLSTAPLHAGLLLLLFLRGSSSGSGETAATASSLGFSGGACARRTARCRPRVRVQLHRAQRRGDAHLPRALSQMARPPSHAPIDARHDRV